jgi:ATP-dependent helicase/nuclease subunit B
MLRDIAQNRRIPFKGEPLSGIQLMGALESRNVSYDHLILPSLNEGVQPSAPGQTLIPYSLKKYFGMPVVEDEMADQSYYFWTLIAGAKSVDILYDNSSSGMKKSEKSRFVQQIQFGDFDNWGSLQESKLKMPLENNKPEEIVIERTAQIQQQLLEQLVDRGLSPSSLMKFLQCELRFYFQFVLGADEYQDIPEEVDARLSGSILHKTMEDLYKPYRDRELQKEDFKDLELRLPQVLREALKEERRLKGKEIAGHDYVAERYLSKIIKRVLEFDCSRSSVYHGGAREKNRFEGGI